MRFVEVSSKGGSFSDPTQIARPLVRAIVQKRTGAMYPDVKTKIISKAMILPLIGKHMIRWVSRELEKRFKDEKTGSFFISFSGLFLSKVPTLFQQPERQSGREHVIATTEDEHGEKGRDGQGAINLRQSYHVPVDT
jgi:hypothetical protein